MSDINYTPFFVVYDSFLSKITDDMYMEFTPQDTSQMLYQLLVAALPNFEFPRQDLSYHLIPTEEQSQDTNEGQDEQQLIWAFQNKLTPEEINIISTYMVVEWISQQLASIENTRMKYSGSDFKFTSQANHIQKLQKLKQHYTQQGFHLQRLYKRRKKDDNGIYRSTFGTIMQKHPWGGTSVCHKWF